MSASKPMVNEEFKATDDPTVKVTVIEASGDEVRFQRTDGSRDVLSRSQFIRDYVPIESRVQH